MRRFKTYKDDGQIVEAILSGGDDSSMNGSFLEHSRSVATWTKVVSSARAITPDVDDEVIDTVMAKIRTATADAANQTGLLTSVFAFRRIAGGLALAAAACLLLMVILVANEPTSHLTDTALSNSVSRPTTQEDVNYLAASPEVDMSTAYADLANTRVIRIEREHGGIRLSNRSSSETIRITTAVRLEAVSGNLRISSL